MYTKIISIQPAGRASSPEGSLSPSPAGASPKRPLPPPSLGEEKNPEVTEETWGQLVQLGVVHASPAS